MAVTSRRLGKVCTSSRASAARRGGCKVRALPRVAARRGETGWLQDLLSVSTRLDDEQVQRTARVLLQEGLSPDMGASCPGEGGGQERMGPAARHVSGWW